MKVVVFLVLLFISSLIVDLRGEESLSTLPSQIVTASEYATFLNAVASSGDFHFLYNEKMGSDPQTASILRLGAPGNYYYEAIAGREDDPIQFVNWFDDARYCNWRQNSLHATNFSFQENDTEDGAYTLDDTDEIVPKNLMAVYWIADEKIVADAQMSTSSDVAENNFFSILSSEHNLTLQVGTTNAKKKSFLEKIIIGGALTTIGIVGLRACYLKIIAPTESGDPISENTCERFGDYRYSEKRVEDDRMQRMLSSEPIATRPLLASAHQEMTLDDRNVSISKAPYRSYEQLQVISADDITTEEDLDKPGEEGLRRRRAFLEAWINQGGFNSFLIEVQAVYSSQKKGLASGEEARVESTKKLGLKSRVTHMLGFSGQATATLVGDNDPPIILATQCEAVETKVRGIPIKPKTLKMADKLNHISLNERSRFYATCASNEEASGKKYLQSLEDACQIRRKDLIACYQKAFDASTRLVRCYTEASKATMEHDFSDELIMLQKRVQGYYAEAANVLENEWNLSLAHLSFKMGEEQECVARYFHSAHLDEKNAEEWKTLASEQQKVLDSMEQVAAVFLDRGDIDEAYQHYLNFNDQKRVVEYRNYALDSKVDGDPALLLWNRAASEQEQLIELRRKLKMPIFYREECLKEAVKLQEDVINYFVEAAKKAREWRNKDAALWNSIANEQRVAVDYCKQATTAATERKANDFMKTAGIQQRVVDALIKKHSSLDEGKVLRYEKVVEELRAAVQSSLQAAEEISDNFYYYRAILKSRENEIHFLTRAAEAAPQDVLFWDAAALEEKKITRRYEQLRRYGQINDIVVILRQPGIDELDQATRAQEQVAEYKFYKAQSNRSNKPLLAQQWNEPISEMEGAVECYIRSAKLKNEGKMKLSQLARDAAQSYISKARGKLPERGKLL